MKQSNNSNNNVLRTFESSFPKDFRQEDIANILHFVTAGKFCQLISLPGGGKATILKLLAGNQNLRQFHLGEKEKSFRFVYLNLLELSNFDQSLIDEFLLHSLSPKTKHSNDPLTLKRQLTEAVSQITGSHTQTPASPAGGLVLLFDHFDEVANKLPRSFFQTLRSARSLAKYRFAAVFATRRDLRGLLDPEILREFYDFFVGNTVYIKLSDQKAINFMLFQIEKILGRQLSPQRKNQIVKLTGGHTKLTKVLAETTLEEDGILEPATLLSKPLIRATLFELWFFLTAQEQHVLAQIVKKAPVAQSESTENLINFGLLKTPPQQWNNGTMKQSFLFTIPLFEQFVQINADTLHQEKIAYNTNTNEITKGEEVISELLSPQENRLLKFLIENQGRIIDRQAIIQAVWPEALQEAGISDEAIDQMIFRLRKKIEDEPTSPQHLLTVKGLGFRFSP